MVVSSPSRGTFRKHSSALRRLVAVATLVVQLVWAIPVCAGVLDEAQEALLELARKAVSVRESIVRSVRQQDDLASQLVTTESELKQVQSELRTIEENTSSLLSQITALERDLSQKEREARSLAVSIEETRESLEMQLRYLQKHARAESLLPLLASSSLAESEITSRSLDQIVRLTDQLARDYEAMLTELQLSRDKLISTVRELEAKREELRRAIEQRRSKLKALETKIEGIRSSLAKAQLEQADYESTLSQIEESSTQLQMLIEQAEREAAERERRERDAWLGSFAWPVSGMVVAGDRAPLESAGTNAGIDIETESGARVLASRSGQVSLAGWVDGYGSTIVINHGSGYSTIYSNCHRLRVATGDFVVSGEVIAEMAESTLEASTRLHFEVRKDGVPLAPLDYLEQR